MTRRRKLLLGLALPAVVIGVGILLFSLWWNPRIEVTLSDGRTVVCERVAQGKKISQTEFEDDVYEYPNSCLDTRKRRFERLMRRLLFWRRGVGGRKVVSIQALHA